MTMKVLWVCNMVPGEVQAKINGKSGTGLWVDHVLSDILRRDLTLRILCRGGKESGEVNSRCSFALFPSLPPHQYASEVEAFFLTQLRDYQPDVIHIWGSEYGHTLAMVNAAEKAGLLNRVVISIQGLCYIYDRHYYEGVPTDVVNRYTLRDLLRRNNIRDQQKVFTLRGKLEKEALQKVFHVMGRTDWDRACVEAIHPDVRYYLCNETLREPFYRDAWRYENCRKHRIFASSCAYPVKGFHYLLEAFAQLLKKYPDAVLAVPGRDFRKVDSFKKRLRESSYERYLRMLVKRYRLEDKVEILGSLSAEQMKEQYLAANVFVLPSTIENSPNSLGEAMLLGVPCVAADVGGVSTMMKHREEGYIYQSTAPYMLSYYTGLLFALEEKAESVGKAAAAHARATHDPEQNLEALLGIYKAVEGK